jgi:hypothetical protein
VPTKTIPSARAARETSVISAPSVLAATGTRISMSSSLWDPEGREMKYGRKGELEASLKDREEIKAAVREEVLEFDQHARSLFFVENTFRRIYGVNTDQNKRCPGRTQKRYEPPLTCFLCSRSAKRERGQIRFSPVGLESSWEELREGHSREA